MGDITKNFSRHEFACKCGCGFDDIKYAIVFSLQKVRDHFEKKITINSGCRCDKYNKKTGGSKNSKHKEGIAADFVVEDVDPDKVADFLEEFFIGNSGLGRYDSFTHFDVRTDKKARWDERTKNE